MKKELKVDEAGAGKRIDVFVGEALTLSRAKLKTLFEDGLVKLNGRRAKKGVMVARGDTLEVDVPETPVSENAAADTSFELRTLYVDDQLVFVDKPAGMPSQPLKPGEVGTVANALICRFPEMAGIGDDPREAGLCHRLDVETSGVLLAARNRATWEAMRAAFSDERAVTKKYLALVKGPLADDGVIELPLEHAGDHVVPNIEKGRPAITEFSVRARQGSYALVDVKLITGVLHQVRAHLASVGAPIVGDTLYGGADEPELKRFFLHAVSLAVVNPVTNLLVRAESPLPPELSRVLDKHLPSAG